MKKVIVSFSMPVLVLSIFVGQAIAARNTQPVSGQHLSIAQVKLGTIDSLNERITTYQKLADNIPGYFSVTAKDALVKQLNSTISRMKSRLSILNLSVNTDAKNISDNDTSPKIKTIRTSSRKPSGPTMSEREDLLLTQKVALINLISVLEKEYSNKKTVELSDLAHISGSSTSSFVSPEYLDQLASATPMSGIRSFEFTSLRNKIVSQMSMKLRLASATQFHPLKKIKDIPLEATSTPDDLATSTDETATSTVSEPPIVNPTSTSTDVIPPEDTATSTDNAASSTVPDSSQNSSSSTP